MTVEFEWTGWDFKDPRIKVMTTALLVGLFALMGWIGSTCTGVDDAGYPHLVRWSDWQLIQAEHAFQVERVVLQKEVDQLVALLNQVPDPVRAQITCDRIIRQYADGQPALDYQRALVRQAAQAVKDHSVGILSLSEAQHNVEQAAQALLIPDVGTEGTPPAETQETSIP